jgi:predicted DNA-binding protein
MKTLTRGVSTRLSVEDYAKLTKISKRIKQSVSKIIRNSILQKIGGVKC